LRAQIAFVCHGRDNVIHCGQTRKAASFLKRPFCFHVVQHALVSAAVANEMPTGFATNAREGDVIWHYICAFALDNN
jgi:hypothetical protein